MKREGAKTQSGECAHRSTQIGTADGRLVRAGVDEDMEIDPAKVCFVFQGASDGEYRGNPSGHVAGSFRLAGKERTTKFTKDTKEESSARGSTLCSLEKRMKRKDAETQSGGQMSSQPLP